MPLPEKGDIAICKHGHVGLVTGIFYYPNRKGNNLKMWRGIHLDANDFGTCWESRAPEKLLTPGDYL